MAGVVACRVSWAGGDASTVRSGVCATEVENVWGVAGGRSAGVAQRVDQGRDDEGDKRGPNEEGQNNGGGDVKRPVHGELLG